MPKNTFLNLNEEKRKKIETALINEFSRETFEEASISNIILEAKIPRGSFYQYFEDKQDAIQYIIEKYLKLEHEKICQILLETEGDIFEASLKMYDYIIKESRDNYRLRLFKNILQELRKSNNNFFDDKYAIESKKKIDKIINIDNLKIEKEDDLRIYHENFDNNN